VCDGSGFNDDGCCGDETTDCAGECGGDAVEDECGVCDGSGLNQCDNGIYVCDLSDCIEGCPEGYIADFSGSCVPSSFVFNSSTLQGFYFFLEAQLDSQNIASDDWVGAFNGDICIGSRQWDTSECGGGVCDLPAMGFDSFQSDATAGYPIGGETLSYKIFDASENKYYNAIPSGDNPSWSNFGTNDPNLSPSLSVTGVTIAGCMENQLMNHHPYHPQLLHLLH
jgi:hypothetical protein